ncbi:MAG: BlaI/MecI/CopY family transcriptional regulator [Candidatus Gastranaerophilales bacterium]|nr:BlaI/MecI/CopY family transcriptional regulator [Candidatus Gastranaerophilales bacterium]
MQSRHGTLEGAILTTLWELENKGMRFNTVKDVFDNMDSDQRAYTTIKTVMDRLCLKNILIREKKGKKFFYRTAYTNYEVVVNSLNEISQKYCSGDLNKLFEILESMQVSRQLVGV